MCDHTTRMRNWSTPISCTRKPVPFWQEAVAHSWRTTFGIKVTLIEVKTSRRVIGQAHQLSRRPCPSVLYASINADTEDDDVIMRHFAEAWLKIAQGILVNNENCCLFVKFTSGDLNKTRAKLSMFVIDWWNSAFSRSFSRIPPVHWHFP